MCFFWSIRFAEIGKLQSLPTEALLTSGKHALENLCSISIIKFGIVPYRTEQALHNLKKNKG